MPPFIDLALGMLCLAGLMLYLAWMCIGEYQRLFKRNPKLLMSVEVFAYLAELGGPGYLAALLFVAGAVMLMSAIWMTLNVLIAALS